MNAVFAQEFGKLAAYDAMQICKEQAMATVAMLRRRIHVQGMASDGSGIGTYSSGYMKVRTGTYKTAHYRSGAKKGAARPKYNRSADTKVILSLTRQMEQDYTIIPMNDGFAAGYNNDLSMRKAMWAQERYGKEILALTDEERAAMMQIAKDGFEKYMESK
jgi:hypothetical protein